MFKSKFIKSYGMPLLLILSILIGSLIGIIFGKDAVVLKPFGNVFLNLMYTIVVPLVFFTISSSIANMVNLKRLSKILSYIFIIFIVTSLISASLMLLVLSFTDVIGNATILIEESTSVQTVDVASQIVKAITVTDFSELLSRSNMLPLIIFSILFGIGTALLKEKGEKLAHSLSVISDVMMKIIKIIMYYAPIGLCAYFAALIGEFGPELLGSYAKSMGLYYGLCVVYFLVFYTLYAYFAGKKKGVKTFFRNIFPSVATSVATQSSLATLPTNLSVTEKMGVPKDIRDVTLPIGTTMHMEGSSMGAILKIVFLFALFNKPFTGIETYLVALLISVLSAVVMSGIPGGGLIGELLIVSLYAFPSEAFPIIATIGWLIDPPATCLNVCGDSVAAMMVTRIVDGKNWLRDKVLQKAL
jgi:Na+/H+-dicarboxylate symporter